MKWKLKEYKRDLRLFNQNKTHLMHQNLRNPKKNMRLSRQSVSNNSNAEKEICWTTCVRKIPKNSTSNLGNRNRARPIYTPILSLTTLKTLHLTPVCAIRLTWRVTKRPYSKNLTVLILDAIDRLKRDKSHGIDLLVNEYYINFKEDMLPFIYKLFNRIHHKRGLRISLFLYLRKGMCLTHIIIEV